MSTTCFVIIWLFGFLSEFGFLQTRLTPLHDDTKSVKRIAKKFIYHKRTKHIKVYCHSIKKSL